MRLHVRTVLLFASLAFAATACTSTQMNQTAAPSDNTSPEPGAPYETKIERFSAGDSEYSGFYNNFEYKATLLNSFVRETQLTRQSQYYQWDAEKLGLEKDKAEKEKAAQTDVYLSFFTPDRKNDNLTDTKSIWRLYIEVGGKRYQGKVKKVRLLLAELQMLYPYHTRWGTPYLVTFPVPTSAIENQAATFTITGPLGTRAVTFRSL